jgi:F-type H+-transporting ATPase subunit delta
MREPTIAKNYAETLLELAQRANDLRGWGEMLDQVSDAMETDRRLRTFLESPRVSAQRKNEILQKAYGAQLPRNFLRFLQATLAVAQHVVARLRTGRSRGLRVIEELSE